VAVMNAGSIQQVGTPDELYRQPHNIFVAKFIGNPGMNIIPSKVLNTGNEGVDLAIGTQVIRLSALSQPDDETIRKHIDREVHVGIRPEAFSILPEQNSVEIRIKTVAVEFLGHESLIYFNLREAGDSCPDIPLIARIAGKLEQPHGGDEMFYINPDSVYLFDRNGDIIR
jgi:ABC-type sugar transport system ATPase subunit